MKCPYCGVDNDEGSKFCCSCGKKLEAEEVSQKTQTSYDSGGGTYTKGDPRIDLSENPIDYMDSSYHPVMDSFGLAEFSALLTNKRVYLNGRMYTGGLSNAQKRKTEQVVNLEDITGSGFVTYSNIHYIIAAVVTFIIACVFIMIGARRSGWDGDMNSPGAVALGVILIMTSIILVVVFFVTRTTHYFIDYAGGGIAFSTGMITEGTTGEIRRFHKNLRIAIDNRRKELLKEQ